MGYVAPGIVFFILADNILLLKKKRLIFLLAFVKIKKQQFINLLKYSSVVALNNLK